MSRPALLAILLAFSTQESARPWTVDPTGRHLVDPSGKPFFWLGDTAWLLSQMPKREDAELYLKTRARQGFTVVQVALVMGEERVAGTLRPNAYGDTAFVDGNPSRPRTTPGARPDDAAEYDYWDNFDAIVEKAEAEGLVLGILPLFVGWRGDAYKFLSPEKAYAYGKFVGERYRARTRILWIMGGDNVPDTDAKKAVWHAMAKGITEGVAGTEDYSRTLMTYHSPGGTTSSTWFHQAPWLDFNMIQTWDKYSEIPKRITADYALTPPKPTGLGEGAYEDGPQYPTKPIDARVIRKQAYESYFAGGYHTFGNTNTWNFGTYKGELTQDWKAALDSPGTRNLTTLKRILTSVDWWTLVPDASLFAKKAPGLAMRSARGAWALVFMPSSGTFTLDLSKIGAERVRATWIDPRTGEESGSDEGSGIREFMTPPGWEDAILRLK